MSRSRKALLLAGFSYSQAILGIAFSVFVTRYLIQKLGADRYGLWISSGALLAYAAFADLGIFGVMPWLIAEADGARDDEKIRSLIAHGLVVGAAAGAVYAAIAGVLWLLYPGLLHLTAVDSQQLAGPLLLLVLTTALTYPIRVFSAVLTGLQDVVFAGSMSLLLLVLNNALVIWFTSRGLGFYGLAIGSAVTPFVGAAACLVRAVIKRPELFRSWPRLQRAHTRSIFSGGAGQWMGSLGWQLAFASDSVIIAYLGHRDLVPVFAVTSRLGLTLMQMGWTLPDSANVGLAQLRGEGNTRRIVEVVSAIVRMHLLTAGGIACVVLAANAGVVAAWVGPGLFGGGALNATFALDIVVLTLTHALVVPVAVLGYRAKVGAITMANGVMHAVLALPLGAAFGLTGVAMATAVSAMVTSIPAALRWLEPTTGIRVSQFVREIAIPWAARIAPLVAMAFALGHFGARRALPEVLALAVLQGLACLWWMRPMYQDLPLPPRARRVLARLRLVAS